MNDIQQPLELDIVKERIIRYASFPLGVQMIQALAPVWDELWIRRELTRTKEALDLVVRYGNLPFGGVHDIRDSVENALRDMICIPKELRDIADGIRACSHIAKYFDSSEIETPYLKELIDSFRDFRTCATHIETCVSINYEVLDHASDALRTIRKSIHGCESEIAKEVQRFISRNASKLMDTITTTRNNRTCVLVKISEKNSIDGFIHGESASGQTAYVEPQSLLILNNRLQSLKSKEEDEIARILYQLSQEVKGIGHGLLGNLETFGILDAIFAKALWAKAMNGCVASLNTKADRLYFKDARHPLIDPEHVVSNTYEIKAPFHSMLITGSNTGGKTVTLKTIGLFVAMTMSGMPIAAEEGQVPLFDGIYVAIGDDQSIQESLSTFSSHISKLAYVCHHASSRSLVLLDELGSGTDPREGEPLAVAILDELRQRHAMIIATTHFSALKTYASAHDDILISSVEFNMEKMMPTYHYIEGMSGQSYAFEIARRYGLRAGIIERAKQQKDADRSRADIALEKLEHSILENHNLKATLEERLVDIKALQESLIKEKAKLEKEKERILEDVREEAIKQLEETKEEAEEVLEKLKELQADAKPHEVAKLKHQIKVIAVDEAMEDEVNDEDFAVGDYVKLKKLNYYGEILSINKEKVCVLANHMKMNTSVNDITHATRSVTKKKDRSYAKSSIKSFSMECNVIGMRVAEAIPVVDKYLDNAILAKVYHVRIIHGMGTGALRKGVHDYLKHNPRIENYVMGGQGEGGLGATVVTLKQKGAK